jgi:hypothetical protein
VERHGQAASSGSKTKAPGSAGGYLLVARQKAALHGLSTRTQAAVSAGTN